MNPQSDLICISNQAYGSFNDRGLQFGEGLFETFRLNSKGEIPLWSFHQARLKEGLQRLGFNPKSFDKAQDFLFANIQSNLTSNPALNAGKLLVTRDAQKRGYATSQENEPNLLLQLFSAPNWPDESQGLKVGISDIRLGIQPALAGIKHCNRLEQVLAQSQLKEGEDDALLLSYAGDVIESCTSNLLVCLDNQWFTPKLDKAGVKGVARQWLITKMNIAEANLNLSDLYNAQHLYLSNSLGGLRPISMLWAERTKEYDSCSSLQEYQTEFKSLFA